MAQRQLNDKQELALWLEFAEGIRNSTPIDTSEKPQDKIKRIARLEADPEEWFKYYFPKYAGAPPAAFHKEAAKRVIDNPEWYEVRNWSRELAKSTRTMMEVMYLALVGNLVDGKRRRKQNVLIISNSKDNADRLLLPFQINFESNNRIINDYGEQANIGSWTIGEFVTKSSVAFRALGAGQSPRGTRNEAIRPDVILFDDLDTDADCLNPDIIDKHWSWVNEAVMPTRSTSNPLLVIWCGNIIAEDCCVLRAQKFADHFEVINIRDDKGKSSWPEKNSEEAINRVLSKLPYSAQQKEYFNNPMTVGKTFQEIKWGECPPLDTLPFVVVYADPATSNKDKPGQSSHLSNSRKAVFVVGRKDDTYYIYYGFLDVMGNSIFIASFYACRDYIKGACPAFYMVENNTLQDPFYEQVLLPLVYAQGKDHGTVLPISPDERKKPEKWFRIEAALEPLNRLGHLVFNIKEKDNPHMQRLETQFKTAKATSKQLDGPDCIEGAVFIINEKVITDNDDAYSFIGRSRSSKYY
jgi:hypothetical protein